MSERQLDFFSDIGVGVAQGSSPMPSPRMRTRFAAGMRLLCRGATRRPRTPAGLKTPRAGEEGFGELETFRRDDRVAIHIPGPVTGALFQRIEPRCRAFAVAAIKSVNSRPRRLCLLCALTLGVAGTSPATTSGCDSKRSKSALAEGIALTHWRRGHRSASESDRRKESSFRTPA
jgi:hypothetical protein